MKQHINVSVVFLFKILLVPALLFSLCSQYSRAEVTLTIAVASNFQLPLQQLIDESAQWKNENIRIVVGASGSLYIQASKGAPFDVFLSANSEWPERLVQQQLATHLHTYAVGKLAIWPVTKTQLAHTSIEQILLRAQGKIAIAYPDAAPYGESAKHYLDKPNLASQLKSKLVMARNVSQAFQYVDSGNASIGFVAESLLIQAHRKLQQNKYLDYYSIPQNEYPAIVQKLVILTPRSSASASVQKKAIDFVAFLLSESSQNKLQSLGYSAIKESP